jgi:molybdopterin synthase sulfur carrier subunit
VKNLRYAVNQEMAQLDSPLKAGDEVAFFPPVTGG